LSIVSNVGWPAVVLMIALLAGCTRIYTWDISTASTARPQSFDVGDLAHQSVATVGVVAPGGLAGYSTSLSHALVRALADVQPPIPGIPAHEIANALNDQGLSAEYGELLAGFARTGIMERERLQRIGSALGFRYMLLPGLAEINHLVLDRFEFTGLKITRTRISTLRVWLQLWDTRTGHIVWESSGEAATSSEVIRHDQIVPVSEIAQKLWRRMLQHDLIGGATGSRSLLDL
jgi:hypothetical protein